jgi:Mycothiol maleylpyruvate isomerase N-terminal domain
MTLLSYDRYRDEIVIQADLLGSCLKDADLAAPVPSCPGWNAGRLVRHLGDVQRWAETTVRTRATGPLLVEHSRGLPSEKANERSAWDVEGATDE